MYKAGIHGTCCDDEALAILVSGLHAAQTRRLDYLAERLRSRVCTVTDVMAVLKHRA